MGILILPEKINARKLMLSDPRPKLMPRNFAILSRSLLPNGQRVADQQNPVFNSGQYRKYPEHVHITYIYAEQKKKMKKKR